MFKNITDFVLSLLFLVLFFMRRELWGVGKETAQKPGSPFFQEYLGCEVHVLEASRLRVFGWSCEV